MVCAWALSGNLSITKQINANGWAQGTKKSSLFLSFFSKKYPGSPMPLFSALQSQDMSLLVLPIQSCPRAWG